MIARSFVVVSMYVLIGKIASAAKEVLAARHFGTSLEMDSFLFVFNLVCWPVGISLPIFTALLVPLYARIGDKKTDGSTLFRSEIHSLVLLVGFAVGILFAVLISLDFFLFRLSGLSATSADSIRQFIWPLAVLIPIGFYGALLSAESLAQQRHLNTLLEGVPAFVVSVALLLWANVSISVLMWSTLIGFFCQTLLLYADQSHHGRLPALRFGFNSTHWKALRYGLSTMVLAQTLQSLTSVIDQFWATRLGEGAISTMGYAQRVLFLILGLTMTAIARAALPVFSNLAAKQDAAMLHIVTQWSALLFVLGLTTAALLWPLMPSIMKLLFQRGAFTQADTIATVSFVRYGLLQLPFYFAAMVLMQSMFANNLYSAVIWIASLNLVLKVLGNVLLTPVFGLNGLALATSVMYAGSVLAIMVVLRIKMQTP